MSAFVVRAEVQLMKETGELLKEREVLQKENTQIEQGLRRMLGDNVEARVCQHAVARVGEWEPRQLKERCALAHYPDRCDHRSVATGVGWGEGRSD